MNSEKQESGPNFNPTDMATDSLTYGELLRVIDDICKTTGSGASEEDIQLISDWFDENATRASLERLWRNRMISVSVVDGEAAFKAKDGAQP